MYQTEPRASLSVGAIKGKKVSKAHLTFALCTNVTGTERLEPFVIGKSKRPRCFGMHFEAETLVHYRSNKTAWMTSALFQEYIYQINTDLRISKRNILLLLDNAPCHFLSSNYAFVGKVFGLSIALLSNVMIVYLPANTTSLLQPLDQGVIAVFKQLYKQQLVSRRLLEIERVLYKIDGARLGKVSVRQAIEWGCTAWSAIPEVCIYIYV